MTPAQVGGHPTTPRNASSSRLGQRRQSRRRQPPPSVYLRRRLVVASTVLGLVALLIILLTGTTGKRSGHTGSGLPFAGPSKSLLRPGPNLRSGSNPAVLPGDVLIADEENNRIVMVNPAGNVVWQFPRVGELAPHQTFLTPNDAFFTPDGKDIIATEENDQVVSLLSVAGRRLLWRYGTPGVAGSQPNQLSNPDDAMVLPGGDVIIADIRNCSLLLTRVNAHAPVERLGINETSCLHDPPLRFGSPNGAFPLTDGNYLVTEIDGDWVDEMTLSGRLLWTTNPPGVAYPSDTNEVAPDVYLTVDYSTPGQVVEFNQQGHLLWRYEAQADRAC